MLDQINPKKALSGATGERVGFFALSYCVPLFLLRLFVIGPEEQSASTVGAMHKPCNTCFAEYWQSVRTQCKSQMPADVASVPTEVLVSWRELRAKSQASSYSA